MTYKSAPTPVAMSINRAAIACGIPKARLIHAVKHGEIPAHRVGNKSLLLARDLEEWIEAHERVKPTQEQSR